MNKIGFGGYRISNRSDDHREALRLAIEEGCSLIDTSSNYTGGESERLIGEVLASTDSNPLVISKVGYVQGNNIQMIKELSLEEELVTINDNLKHSIHPDFIDNQLKVSLKRLKTKTIDSYLLHNPEYYLKTQGSTKEEMYKRIEKALVFLETKVSFKQIKSYGISSNTFVDPKEDHESIDILEVLKIVKKNNLKSFKYIQFPLNLLELGSQMKQFDGLNLCEVAKENNLITLTNRPFNSFTDKGLVRLCEYEVDESLTEEHAAKSYKELTKTLKEKWNSERDDEEEEIEDLAVYKQISGLWFKQNSVDAVEQIFYQYFFPMLTSVWGRSLDPNEAKPFFELFELAVSYTRKNMNTRAQEFKKVAKDTGLIDDKDMDLQSLALDKYFELGADYVLCGIKSKEYVENLKSYF